MKKVAIVMGSASDKPIALDAVKTLEEYGVPSVVRVLSAHRTPQEARDFTLSLEAQDVGAVIALAGMAAHLAGAVAANTVLPVIGVPVASGGLGGLDALLSTVQMPSGIPVAAVAVGGRQERGHTGRANTGGVGYGPSRQADQKARGHARSGIAGGQRNQ